MLSHVSLSCIPDIHLVSGMTAKWLNSSEAEEFQEPQEIFQTMTDP